MVAILIALTGVVFQQAAPGGHASCEVEPPSIVSRSPSNLVQVSNLALVHLRAAVTSRRLPPSGVLNGLRVETTVYQVAADGVRTVVPSTVKVSGGGVEAGSDYAVFTLDIPIESQERDAAIRDYLSAVARAAAASTNERERALAATLQSSTAASAFVPMFRQHRVGLFRVDCRILDDGRQIAVGSTDFEILFTGRFFDQEAFRPK